MNRLVRIATVLAACLGLDPLARAADPVTFGLDWVAEPEYGGYYQALAHRHLRQTRPGRPRSPRAARR